MCTRKRLAYSLNAAICALAGIAGVVQGGCSNDSSVTISEKRVVTEPAASTGSSQSSAERFGLAPPMSAAGQESPSFTWQAPEGWQAVAATPLRPANFKIGSAGEVECYVSMLSGTGGGTLANVNRWRKQMSLPETTQEELNALPQVTVLGKPALLVELDGEFVGMDGTTSLKDAKMLGAIVEDSAQMLFVKMVGPKDVVEKEKEPFKAFCASLQQNEGTPTMAPDVAASGSMPNDAVHGGAHGGPLQLAWDKPADWTEGPQKPMRAVTFLAGPNSEAECYITILSGSGGGVEGNINRWMQQMGKPEMSALELDTLPTIDVLGVGSKLVEILGDYTGMDGAAKSGYMLLGLVCPLGNTPVFVKMTGPEAIVKTNKDAFVAFCKSLRQAQ